MARANALPVLVLLAALSVACASAPPPAAANLRSEYTQAASDPRIAKHAAIELNNADQAVRRVEVANPREEDVVRHLSYVAKQRIEIARAVGEAGALEGEVTQLGERRDEMRLQARTVEAESARDEAQVARDVAASAIDRARALEKDLEELKAKETERGLVMTMSDVLFAFNSAQLQPGAERALGEVAKLLNEFPDREIAIEGHTDSVGSDSYNRGLSESRAEAVATFLRSRGVDSARITVRGLGEQMPVASNDEDAGRQANRRVEIVLAKPAGAPASVSSAPPAGPDSSVIDERP